MASLRNHKLRWCFILVIFTSFSTWGQTIGKHVDANRQSDRSNAVFPGKMSYHARRYAQYDQGRESDRRFVREMRLLLKVSPEKEEGLNRCLEEQRTPSSPNFHKWLTPDQFAAQFGLDDASIDNAIGWLKLNGMSEITLGRGHRSIAFSGEVSKISEAFKTEIHAYNVNGKRHFANTVVPQIPSELASLVSGITGLNDFGPAPLVRSVSPQYVFGPGAYLMGPDDLATMYNIKPLYDQGIDGTGIRIAVPGAALVDIADYRAYRTLFNLPPNDFTVVPVPNMQDNLPSAGSVNGFEAALDLDLVSAVARNATILYIQSHDVVASVQYVIDNQLADIITFSYGTCAGDVASVYQLFQSMAQQANAEGITFAAASGDNGPANCDWNNEPAATQGLADLLPASVPEVTAVGGTRVADRDSTQYWSPANNAFGGNLLTYVPETTWNPSDGSGGAIGPVASGGGISTYFRRPGFQAGVGDPNIRNRMTPDVSLNASDGYVPNAFYFLGQLGGGGGTSASTPIFAGMMALVQQYLLTHNEIAKPGLGNVNPNLYNVSTNAPQAFHDITTGENSVKCVIGTPDCTTGKLGYPATMGYDLATGLGSLDLYALASNWSHYQSVASSTVLTSDVTSVTAGKDVTFNTVTTSTGGNPENGVVTFTYHNPNVYYGLSPNHGSPMLINTTADSSGKAVVSTDLLPVGVNSVHANYGGSASVNSSNSNTLTITVKAFPTTTTATPEKTNAPIGSQVSVAINVTDESGHSPIGPSSQPGTQGFVGFGRVPGPWDVYELLPDNGTMTVTTTPLVAGDNLFAVSFAGTAYAGTSMTTITIRARYPSSLVLTATSSGNPVTSVRGGTPLVLTATMSGSTSSTRPSGRVNFMDGATLLGTGSLDSTSTASLTVSTLSEGTHAVSAVFNGDNLYEPSNSSALDVVVTKIATTISVQTTSAGSPVSSVISGSPVTIVASVTNSESGPTQTGTISFMDGANLLGTAPLDSNLRASFTPTSLSSGVHVVTATYAGNDVYRSSTSPALTITVQDFTVHASNAQMTVVAGQSQSAQLAIAPQFGFTGNVAISCALPANMREASCTATTVQITGTATEYSNVTVKTAAPHTVTARQYRLQFVFATSFALFVGGFFCISRRANLAARVFLTLLIAVILFGAAACGGGGSSSTPQPPTTDQGTAPGTYLLTITATSGTASHATNVSVVVN